jgi:hypothetical protein
VERATARVTAGLICAPGLPHAIAVKMPAVTPSPHPVAIPIHPAPSPLDFLSRTLATTPSPNRTNTIVLINSPNRGPVHGSLISFHFAVRRQAIEVTIALSSNMTQICDSYYVRVMASGIWNKHVTIRLESGKVQIRRIAHEILGRYERQLRGSQQRLRWSLKQKLEDCDGSDRNKRFSICNNPGDLLHPC